MFGPFGLGRKKHVVFWVVINSPFYKYKFVHDPIFLFFLFFFLSSSIHGMSVRDHIFLFPLRFPTAVSFPVFMHSNRYSFYFLITPMTLNIYLFSRYSLIFTVNFC